MMEFTRPDSDATCNPKELAEQLSEALGESVTCDIDGDKVIVYEDIKDTTAVQTVIDAYTYDPTWEPPGPDRDWRQTLQAEIEYFDNQLTNWPTSSPGPAFVATLVRRLVRNQLRLLRLIRDNVQDVS